ESRLNDRIRKATMITCPWCGTNYATFQSNCQNCGGPLPLATEPAPSEPQADLPEKHYPQPPPAPRPISQNYVWRLLGSDGGAVAAFVFGLLGTIFTFVRFILTIAIVTAFVGIPFALLGLLFLAVGVGVGLRRYRAMQNVVEVLRIGEAAAGQIDNVEENLYV